MIQPANPTIDDYFQWKESLEKQILNQISDFQEIFGTEFIDIEIQKVPAKGDIVPRLASVKIIDTLIPKANREITKEV